MGAAHLRRRRPARWAFLLDPAGRRAARAGPPRPAAGADLPRADLGRRTRQDRHAELGRGQRRPPRRGRTHDRRHTATGRAAEGRRHQQRGRRRPHRGLRRRPGLPAGRRRQLRRTGRGLHGVRQRHGGAHRTRPPARLVRRRLLPLLRGHRPLVAHPFAWLRDPLPALGRAAARARGEQQGMVAALRVPRRPQPAADADQGRVGCRSPCAPCCVTR